jgi:K+ transporter
MLVIMYSVNVFLTFSLSETGMVRFWLRQCREKKKFHTDLIVHTTGLILCLLILIMMIVKKFSEGAWITAMITGVCIALCFVIRTHYVRMAKRIKALDLAFDELPPPPFSGVAGEFDPKKPTAVILVGGFSGLGKHIFLNIFRHFHDTFKNVLFVTVGIATSDFFKGEHGEHIEKKTEQSLKNFVDFSRQMGVPAAYEYRIGAEVVESASELCVELSKKYPKAVFFAGELVFERPRWYHRILHNETAYAILRRIRFAGLPMVILPIRVREKV